MASAADDDPDTRHSRVALVRRSRRTTPDTESGIEETCENCPHHLPGEIRHVEVEMENC
jgi:hypothetical protein